MRPLPLRYLKLLMMIVWLVVPFKAIASSNSAESACSLIDLMAERWAQPHISTNEEIKLFRVCAFELSATDHFQISIVTARELFSPHLMPRAMTDELKKIFDIKSKNQTRKLKTAVEFLGADRTAKTRKAAIAWLEEIIISDSPCRVKAMHELGRLNFDPTSSSVFEPTEAQSQLMVAALAKYPPAMADYGRYLLSKPRKRDDTIRGVGFLLAAKEEDEEVDKDLAEILPDLPKDQLDDARIQRDIILEIGPALDYSACSS